MAGTLIDVSRGDKLDIARNLIIVLKGRQQSGPPEPGLDAFISELEAVASALSAPASESALPDPDRSARLARADVADINLDTWLRHIESFLSIEANRRGGPNVPVARALYAAACPDGLAHVDARVVEQNAHCRETLSVLRAPRHASAIAAIELPTAWIAKLEVALVESEVAIADIIGAQREKGGPGALGRDAEDDWVDLMIRLRKYMGSRASRTDFVRISETRALLKPLLGALDKMKSDAAARAAKRTVKLPKP
jgi:hypothetical protein